ncbi:Os1348 family NHLP clan protein [Bacteriovoracales bacterium]|nr:Os1348 family NHLP clan protein [Bacteriovoracales bacterium]
MAIKDVKEILEKAHNDEDFHKLLLDNPDEALKNFNLTDKEKSKFKGVTKSQLKAYKSNLEKRFSMDGSFSNSDDEEWWTESVTD